MAAMFGEDISETVEQPIAKKSKSVPIKNGVRANKIADTRPKPGFVYEGNFKLHNFNVYF